MESPICTAESYPSKASGDAQDPLRRFEANERCMDSSCNKCGLVQKFEVVCDQECQDASLYKKLIAEHGALYAEIDEGLVTNSFKRAWGFNGTWGANGEQCSAFGHGKTNFPVAIIGYDD